MVRRVNTEVLIVGGGPVGLTSAMDLAQRGVGVTLAEMRAAGEPPFGMINEPHHGTCWRVDHTAKLVQLLSN